MPTTTAAKKLTVSKGKGGRSAPKEPDRRTLHRVGTLVNDASLDHPRTVGQRMAVQRLALRLTQEQVATQVIFKPKTGSRMDDDVVLSRNAYCMYETGGVEPDLQKIVEIAKVLKVTPQWLAFGIGERKTVDAYSFDQKTKQFVSTESWILPEEWLADNFGVQPAEIELYLISDYKAEFSPGDVVIVRRKVEPAGVGGEFLFLHKGDYKIAHVTRPHRSESIRVFTADATSHEEIPLTKVNMLGRVIGKIGSLERRT